MTGRARGSSGRGAAADLAGVGERALVARIRELLGRPAGPGTGSVDDAAGPGVLPGPGDAAAGPGVLAGPGDATAGPGVLVGPGDDAAVVDLPSSRIVVTTDAQHDGVHFRQQWITAADLGRRALAVSVSDIGAMGAVPRLAVVALALPGSTPVSWVEELVGGLRSGAEELACPVVGGDVARVPDRVSVVVSVVGSLGADGEPVRRGGAAAGDACWVTGWPGRAGAGRLLLAGEEARGWAGGGPADACRAAFQRPVPPLALGARIGRDGLARAMIDLSDGLALDASRVCEASGTGLLLEADLLDVDPVLRELEPERSRRLDLVLGGGEDYQLLLAVPREGADALEAAAASLGVPARRIGSFRDTAAGLAMADGGTERPLEEAGWDHFGGAPGAAAP